MPGFLDEVEACVPALRRYARALTHDAERADDLVQDCLERAIRKQALFRPLGPVRAWLFKILLNIHRNDVRRRGRAPASLDAQRVEPVAPATQPGRLALAETARAMEMLPPEQREVLLLVAVEGMTLGEAAAVTGVPLGTVMSRIGRARASLRQITGADVPRMRTVK